MSAAAVNRVKEQVRSLLDGAESIPVSDVINREFVHRCMVVMPAVGALDALEQLGLLSDEEAAAYRPRLRGMGFEQGSRRFGGHTSPDPSEDEPPDDGAPPASSRQ